MAWDLGSLAEYIKLPARFYTAGAVVAGILLFVPASALRLVGVDAFASKHRDVIGLGFLIMTTLTLTQLTIEVYGLISRRRQRAAQLVHASIERTAAAKLKQEERDAVIKVRQDRLARLTRDEQSMLRPYVVNNVRSRRLPMNSATRHALHGSEILASAAQLTDYDSEFDDFAIESLIQPWALEALRKEPELVGLTKEQLVD